MLFADCLETPVLWRKGTSYRGEGAVLQLHSSCGNNVTGDVVTGFRSAPAGRRSQPGWGL